MRVTLQFPEASFSPAAAHKRTLEDRPETQGEENAEEGHEVGIPTGSSAQAERIERARIQGQRNLEGTPG
jgi:hypothetical protein